MRLGQIFSTQPGSLRLCLSLPLLLYTASRAAGGEKYRPSHISYAYVRGPVHPRGLLDIKDHAGAFQSPTLSFSFSAAY